LAFLLSLLSDINEDSNNVKAIIIAPTRELSIQINDVFKSLKSGLKSTLCYGGHSMKDERNSLSETPDIIIGTPGRILDHLEREHINIKECNHLVIDEFDKCLEFGFEFEMEEILHFSNPSSKKLLVSATSIDEFPRFLRMKNAYTINGLLEDNTSNILEFKIEYENTLFSELVDLIYSFGRDKSIIFCNYREVVDDLSSRLRDEGITNTPYHGGLKQDERERALIKYRNDSSNTLVCTDLGARGLDIPEVKHVVHYQFPGSLDAFIHRKGRTARMSKDGASYLFLGPETQLPEYLEEPHDTYSLSGHKDVKPLWKTVYLSGGKKEKVNKIDIVGFFSKKGNLKPNEIGLINVLDHSAYVAIHAKKANNVIRDIKKEKIKGKRLKIAIAR
jgi:ATP-independent RNA helicase DbpA